jgi:GxxExxY protein
MEPQINADKEEGISIVSQRVIGGAFTVANSLGSGFLAKMYENALAHELRKAGLTVSQQHAMTIQYDGVVVGDDTADLLVEECLLVELKCVRTLDHFHSAQCLDYLKATALHIAFS